MNLMLSSTPVRSALVVATLAALPVLAQAQFKSGGDFLVGGSTRLTGSVDAGGTLRVEGPATLTLTDASRAGRAEIAGTVGFSPGKFTTLTVAGDLVGQDGLIRFNTALGDDGSRTDRLIIGGASSGSMRVAVANANGVGAQTDNGIQLIQVNGASGGNFALQDRAVAGAYEYKLYKGGKNNPNDGSWYLRSEATSGSGTPTPVTPTPGKGVTPAPMPMPVYRPEGGAYLANQAASIGMFQHQMHDRMGEPDFARGGDKAPAIWTRVQRRQLDSNAGYQQLAIGSDTSLLQVGGELAARNLGGGRLHVGAMAGAGRTDSNVGSRQSGYRAKGKVRGYSAGLYATWFGNAAEQTGLYVDSWLQYGWADNKVNGQYLAQESYKSKSWSASLEGGYSFRLAQTERFGLFLEPQAQVIYTDYDARQFAEANGSIVDPSLAGTLVTRAGVRLFGNSGDSANNRVQPFLTLNWWRSDKQNRVRMDGDALTLNLPRDRYEAKLGAQLQLGGGWTGWGNAAYQTGSKGFRDIGGQVGANYRW
ncbi:MAG TPA: autotransporter outer membrane beta-barrel domain-containing protein [Stenotrophomonas sp.]|nr:autotransporter outer membrane beta-barrel domain-containing protein [Stenotrophomonas sp.]